MLLFLRQVYRQNAKDEQALLWLLYTFASEKPAESRTVRPTTRMKRQVTRLLHVDPSIVHHTEVTVHVT